MRKRDKKIKARRREVRSTLLVVRAKFREALALSRRRYWGGC
jgi:hypothetical protein